MTDFIGRRSGFWYYVRRVPAEYTALDARGIVKTTTKIRIADDPRGIRARRIAQQLNAETEAYWRGLVSGQAAEARRRYDAARSRARAMGFDYRPTAELAAAPIGDILARLERLVDKRELEDEGAVAAALGGEEQPALMLSDLVDEYERISLAGLKAMSPDQIRRWRNPKTRAVENLVSVLGGDRPLTRITRGDALDFRTWWQDRILNEDVQIETANKDIGHLNKMLRTIERHHRIGIDPVFSQLRFEGAGTRSRAAYEARFVAGKILVPGALDGLNEEAIGVIHLMAETGLRLSEAVNLTADTIDLAHDVPHVRVRPIGRKMKTEQSARDIPLVGTALAAMLRHPAGFPRYRDKAASLSALVNKALAARGLRPTPQHTLYSLRHTFEDRLTAVEAPEKLIAALMGHKYSRPKYGAGPSLEQKRHWLTRIAFDVTSTH